VAALLGVFAGWLTLACLSCWSRLFRSCGGNAFVRLGLTWLPLRAY
jgi:hypothetical protein